MAVQKLVTAPATQQTGGVPRMSALDTSEFVQELGGSLDSIRVEVNDAFEDMKTFLNREPDEIMRICAGHSARISELRVKAMRIEDWYRPAKDLRTRELEPVLDELEKQWRNASRLHSVRELDWRMESGER